MDIWCIKETFVDCFYERYSVPVGDNWVIVDVGAGLGDFSIFCAEGHPTNRVIAFEPTPESFGLLEDNVQANELNNIEAFNLAIWSGNNILVMDTVAGEPVQFTSQIASGEVETPEKIVVSSISLEAALELAKVDTCSLLKMDCEGAEYEILYHTPDNVLHRVERIVMEYHDDVSPNTHIDLAKFLKAKGYTVKTYPNFVHSNLGYLYACR